jgi:outer membrane protein, multidrug efflux system
VGPDYHSPRTRVSERWHELPTDGVIQPATQPASVPTPTAPSDLAQWWRSFADPQLDRLIERAATANLDLRIAEARVREARAQRGIVAGERYPTVNGSGAYARREPSENGAEARLFSPITGLIGLSKSGLGYELYQLGFDASWELDLFGRVRRGVEAADANTTAALEGRRDLLISLEAEVARNYVEMRGAQRRLAIARENVAAQAATLELARQRRSVGAVTELDVTRAAAQLSVSEAYVPLFVRQTRFSLHALSVLLNEDLDALSGELSTEGPAPVVSSEIPLGLPTDLLRRRPDIRQAERQLAGATAQIGVAIADLFPRLGISGTIGLEATKFPDLGDWNSHTFGFGPWFRWPIFEGGRIRSNIQVQDARQEQALAQYERVVLNAVREVEDALVACTTEKTRCRALAEAVESSRQAVDLAQLSYEEGATDLLAVLDAQRILYAAQDALAGADQTVVISLIALYKALGGGWDMGGVKPP